MIGRFRSIVEASPSLLSTRECAMRKLSLHLEELVVESFSTTDAARGRGTARGMDSVTRTRA